MALVNDVKGPAGGEEEEEEEEECTPRGVVTSQRPSAP
jgi:hypothetical protein